MAFFSALKGLFVDSALTTQRAEEARLLSEFRTASIKCRLEMLSTYEGAEKNRLTHDWKGKKVSADQAILPDLATVNARAREAARDDWGFRSILNAFRKNVVGTGITPHSNARDPKTDEAMADFNKTCDRWWLWWSRNKLFVDTERKRTFRGMQALMIREMITVGQTFIMLNVTERTGMVGLALQAFGPEQLDLTLTRWKNGNEVRGGIEIDAQHAAVAYHVMTRDTAQGGQNSSDDDSGRGTMFPKTGTTTPSPFRFTSERIIAAHVLHVFDAERVMQTQGVTPLSSVLMKMRQFGMYTHYEVVAARQEACFGAFIWTEAPTSEFGGTKTPAEDNGVDSDGNPEIRMEPGMINYLKPGERVEMMTPKRPGGNFAAFTESQIIQIAAAADVDYAQMARDYTKGNFSAQRQATIEANKVWDEMQQTFVDEICRPIRDLFVKLLILEGKVEAQGFWDDDEKRMCMLEANWQGPPRHWVEPVKEANALKIALAQRLITRGQIQNRLGANFEDVMRELADEKALADELGLTLPEDQPPKGTMPGAAAPAKPPKKKPDEPDKPEGNERDKRT